MNKKNNSLSAEQKNILIAAHKLRINENHQLNDNRQSLTLNNNEKINLPSINPNSGKLIYVEIGKKENFVTEDVFGPYVQIDPTKPDHGRHIIPPRNIQCPYCGAFVWLDEKSGGTKNKPEFSLCCAKGIY